MSINYLFFSLQRFGRLEGSLLELHDRFWRSYLSLRRDDELQAVIQPWFAWRALVLASPVWYRSIEEDVRVALLSFARNVVSAKKYNYRRANRFLGGLMVEKVQGFAIWLTGVPSSGKTTTAHALGDTARRAVDSRADFGLGRFAQEAYASSNLLTGRKGLVLRRDRLPVELLTTNGVNVLISATGSRRAYRDQARRQIGRFAEVYVDCPQRICRERDPKELWRQSEVGGIEALPGVGAPYEPPNSPEVRVDTAQLSAEEAARLILGELDEKGFFQV